MARLRWRDYAGSVTSQPPLIAPADLPSQPKRRRPGAARKPDPLESELLGLIKAALKLHPQVADIDRINVMAGRLYGKDGKPSRFLRSCQKGRVDLDGFSKSGLVIAIEVKRPSTRGRVTPEQAAYLARVKAAGGLAGVATSVEEAFAIVEGRG